MAGQAAKKTHAENARTLKNLRLQCLAVNTVYILYRVFWHYSTLSFSTAVAYVSTAGLALYLCSTLKSMAVNTDINGEGLVMYIYDIIYVTWFVHLTSMFWSKMWYTYLVIPAYAGYKVYDMVLKPYLNSGRVGAGAGAGPNAAAGGSRDEKEAKKKSKVKYGRA